jgi:hypothetical protein
MSYLVGSKLGTLGGPRPGSMKDLARITRNRIKCMQYQPTSYRVPNIGRNSSYLDAHQGAEPDSNGSVSNGLPRFVA